MCFLRSALPQLVNKDSWCQNSTKEWGLRMRILFNDFGIKRKLTWPLMRILNLPVIHTFPTQGSSVPQEPRMYLLFYSTNIFISLGTSRWGGGTEVFPHEMITNYFQRHWSVCLLHKWNCGFIPRIWIQLWFTFLWNLEVSLERATLSYHLLSLQSGMTKVKTTSKHLKRLLRTSRSGIWPLHIVPHCFVNPNWTASPGSYISTNQLLSLFLKKEKI